MKNKKLAKIYCEHLKTEKVKDEYKVFMKVFADDDKEYGEFSFITDCENYMGPEGELNDCFNMLEEYEDDDYDSLNEKDKRKYAIGYIVDEFIGNVGLSFFKPKEEKDKDKEDEKIKKAIDEGRYF